MAVVWARVAQLQLLQGERWQREARQAREQTVELDPRRGPILDGAGRLLVEDAPVLQLALVLSDWKERSRYRCDVCGTVHFRAAPVPTVPHSGLRPGGAAPRRAPRCRCKASEDRLIPLGEGDLTPLEDLLGMPHGAIAERALEREAEVDRLVEAERARLLEWAEDDFLIEDRVRIYRLGREELPIPLAAEVSEAVARFVALDEEGVTRGLVLRPSHRRVAREAGVLRLPLGTARRAESREELARFRREHPEDDVDYGTLIGQTGLEKFYDDVLLGRPGRERRARDEQGEFRTVMVSEPPRAGGRVVLRTTLEDCALAQRCLESLPDLAQNYAPRTRPSGALVLMDATNGEILALAELPLWRPEDAKDDVTLGGRVAPLADRSLGDWVPARRSRAPEPDAGSVRTAARLTGFRRLAMPWRARERVLEPWTDLPEGFDRERWRKSLSQPTGAMLSRVSRVAVEPGSTLKVFNGLAMLESGLPLPVEDVFACLGQAGKPACHRHPPVDFEGMICHSCNQYAAFSLRGFRSHWATYRYSVAAFLDRLGFGHSTGSDLEGESRGRWLRAEEWGSDERPVIQPDDGFNVAIGQGEVLVTPLQMVRAVAVIANGGRLVTPHLAARIEDASGVDRTPAFPVVDLKISAASLARVREGMHRVVYDSFGTAHRSHPWGLVSGRVFGKTGTAEVGSGWRPFETAKKTDVTHQWFVGFVERDGRPPLAIAVVYHARTETAAGLTAARTAGAFLQEWCAR
jgi:cell division protein FtsI/penicillin-binding protein 2